MSEPVYRVYSQYLKEKYQEKVYKLPINLPITCPNRESGAGCVFCAEAGTGFEALENTKTVTQQLEENKAHIMKRYKARKFIAYFQNYTNTYMPLEQFKRYIHEAAHCEDVVEISVSTRPDCIRRDYLDVLRDVREQYGIEITIEMGLQTVNYHTLEKIRRGHTLAEFLESVLLISSYNFTICTHIILNLPWDDALDVMETAKILSALPVQIVKLHSLYVAKNTWLSKEYERGTISICEKNEYFQRLGIFLEYLRPEMVVERLFSRIPEEDALFCNWGTSWWKLQDEFLEYMEEHKKYQGKCFHYLGGKAY